MRTILSSIVSNLADAVCRQRIVEDHARYLPFFCDIPQGEPQTHEVSADLSIEGAMSRNGCNRSAYQVRNALKKEISVMICAKRR